MLFGDFHHEGNYSIKHFLYLAYQTKETLQTWLSSRLLYFYVAVLQLVVVVQRNNIHTLLGTHCFVIDKGENFFRQTNACFAQLQYEKARLKADNSAKNVDTA